jgi:hypothetical protein
MENAENDLWELKVRRREGNVLEEWVFVVKMPGFLRTLESCIKKITIPASPPRHDAWSFG